MLLGMRTLKTAVGVVLCLLLSYLLRLGNPLFAVIAFIVVMQNTLNDTFAVGKFRIYGTVLGGVLGGIFYLLSPGNLFLAGAGIILIIVIMNQFKWSPAITIGLIVFISILAGDPPEFSIWTSAAIRVVDTIIGILIAFAINFFISPPEYEGQLVQHLKTLRTQEWVYLHDLIGLGEKPPLREMVQTMDQANATAAILEKETLPLKWWRQRSTTGLSDSLKSRLYHLSRAFIHLGILKELPGCQALSPGNLSALEELNILIPEGKASAWHPQDVPPKDLSPKAIGPEEESTLFNYHLMRLLFHIKESDQLEQVHKNASR